MGTARWGGKEEIAAFLMDREGYTRPQALRFINAFLSILREGLKAGKKIKLEGLGTLVALRHGGRKDRIEKNLYPTKGPVVVHHKHEKTIMLIRVNKENFNNE